MAPKPDWGGTIGAFVVLLVIAKLLSGGGIFVWYLYLQRQYPGIKWHAAARIQLHETIDVVRAKLEDMFASTSKSDNDPIGDGNSPESEAENKIVTPSDNDTGDNIEAGSKTSDDDFVDSENPLDVETDSKTVAPDDDVLVDGTPVDIVDGTPVDIETEAAAPTDIDANAEVFQELQTIVDNSVHATPQEKAELVESL